LGESLGRLNTADGCVFEAAPKKYFGGEPDELTVARIAT